MARAEVDIRNTGEPFTIPKNALAKTQDALDQAIESHRTVPEWVAKNMANWSGHLPTEYNKMINYQIQQTEAGYSGRATESNGPPKPTIAVGLIDIPLHYPDGTTKIVPGIQLGDRGRSVSSDEQDMLRILLDESGRRIPKRQLLERANAGEVRMSKSAMDAQIAALAKKTEVNGVPLISVSVHKVGITDWNVVSPQPVQVVNAETRTGFHPVERARTLFRKPLQPARG